MAKLTLRDGPLAGSMVAVAGAKPIVIAHQVIGGERVIVTSPFSSVKGSAPALGAEIILSTYSGTGEFVCEGTDVSFGS